MTSLRQHATIGRIGRFHSLRSFYSLIWHQKRSVVTRNFPPEHLGLKHIAGPKQNHLVDIIGVHGLAADPQRTWLWRTPSHERNLDHTGPSSIQAAPQDIAPVNWLKDLLPREIPKARILTFNYASQWLSDAPRETVRGIALKLLASLAEERRIREVRDKKSAASKPLVLIGHSFGGLVLQMAMVLAAQDKAYNDILSDTRSILFLGTPHRGTKAAAYGTILSRCAAALGMGSEHGLLNKLEEGAEDIQNTVDDFARQVREFDINVTCFYELYKTQITPKKRLLLPATFSTMVVEKDSAVLPGWESFGLQTDHSGLNKFKSRDDANFKLVASKLRDSIKDLCKKQKNIQLTKNDLLATADTPKYFVVPHMRNSTFQARQAVSKKLTAMMKRAESLSDHDHVRMAIYGLPGSGKTQRALHTAYSLRNRYNVFWVNASSFDTFKETLTTIGRAIHPKDERPIRSEEDLMRATKAWLESPASGQWFMVVDGIHSSSDEFFSGLEEFLPHKRGILLFTAATAQIIGVVGCPNNAIEIGPMPVPDAKALFIRVSNIKDCDEAVLTKLLEHLTHLPLAITQAASYIRSRSISVERYLALMKDAEDNVKGSMFDATSADPHDYASFASRSVMTTQTLTFDHITKIKPEAMHLFQYLSLLGPNVPLSLLAAFRARTPALRANVSFHDAMGLLIAHRLVTPSHSNNFVCEEIYRTHSLACTQARVRLGSARGELLAQVLADIEEAFPQLRIAGPALDVDLCAGLLQHAEAVLDHARGVESLRGLSGLLMSKLELYKLYEYEYEAQWLDALSNKSAKQNLKVVDGLEEGRCRALGGAHTNVQYFS